MNPLPIIQTFFDTPVRFFKAEFAPDLYRYDDGIGLKKVLLETWAIPLPDYAKSIGYDVEAIRRLILRNGDVFDGFFTYEVIPDRLGGQQRRTILMAVEMCDGLNMKLHTTRIKDPAVREAVTRFQRWVLYAFHLIRTGKLRPTRWNRGEDIPAEYFNVLSLPYSRESKEAATAIAEKEDKSLQTIYRRLKKFRGENTTTAKGTPKKSPSFKGCYRETAEFKTVEFIFCQYPKLKKKEMARIAGVPYGKVTRWLRVA